MARAVALTTTIASRDWTPTSLSGLAHIAYSHDSPDVGGTGTYTGYAVQTGGTAVGAPN